MDWGELGKQIIDKGGQILGEALPFPGTGAAADALSAALGCDKSPDAISEAIAKDPKAAAKIRQVELDHKAQLKEIRADHKEEMRKLQAQDAEGAREFGMKEMESEDPYIRRTRPKVVRMSMWLVVGFVVVSVLLFAAVMLVPWQIPETNANLGARGYAYLAGIVFAAFGTAFRSYTTRRSMDKMVAAGQTPKSFTDKLSDAFSHKEKKAS